MTKTLYEANRASAESADASYKKLDEPDWDKLQYFREKGQPNLENDQKLAAVLPEMDAEITAARKGASLNGAVTLAEAEKKRDEADATYEALLEKRANTQLKVMDADTRVQNLDKEVKALETRLAGLNAPDTGGSDVIDGHRITIQEAKDNVAALTGGNDIEAARKLLAKPDFKDFKSAEIKLWKDRSEDLSISDEGRDTAQRKVEQLIAAARKSVADSIKQYDSSTRAIKNLGGNPAKTTGSNEYAKVEAELSAKRKSLADEKAKRETLQRQIPSDKATKDAETRRNNWGKIITHVKRVPVLVSNKAAVKPWIEARLERNRTEARRVQSQADYQESIRQKDARLEKARAEFNALMAQMRKTRSDLSGQPQDEAYWNEISQMKADGEKAYDALLKDLNGLDCFKDVQNVLNTIRERKAQLAAVYVPKDGGKKPVRIAKAPPTRRMPPKAKVPKKTIKKPPPKPKNLPPADFNGKWGSSEGDMEINQSGSSISGKYAWAGGKFSGTVKGRTAYIMWTQNNNRAGTAEWTLSDSGQSFSGPWEYTVPEDHKGKGGTWTGTKKKDK